MEGSKCVTITRCYIPEENIFLSLFGGNIKLLFSATIFNKLWSHVFLISKFRRVLNVVCFLLGNTPASKFYVPTFRNTLFHLHRQVRMKNSSYVPAYEDGTEKSVPKRRHIKFRRQGITQKKAYILWVLIRRKISMLRLIGQIFLSIFGTTFSRKMKMNFSELRSFDPFILLYPLIVY
jgi:hypothetical protein